MTGEGLLRYLGVPGNYCGFKQLSMAIECVAENEYRILNIYHDIYEVIAENTGSTPKGVEKNIRTLISVSWQKEYFRIQFEAISGCPYPDKPLPSEFLDIVSNFMRKHVDTDDNSLGQYVIAI